mgnify:CR=1 FL=1
MIGRLVRRDDGTPSVEQRTRLFDVAHLKIELLSEQVNAHRSMAVNSGEHLGRAVDLGGIHAADLGISSKEERRDAELGADSLGDMMDIEAASMPKKNSRTRTPQARAARKMTAFVDEHECRQEKKAPKDGGR